LYAEAPVRKFGFKIFLPWGETQGGGTIIGVGFVGPASGCKVPLRLDLAII